jgi:hypothetical protein
MHKSYITSATMQRKLAHILSNRGTQQLLDGSVLPRPWGRHYDKGTSLTTATVEEVVPCHQG